MKQETAYVEFIQDVLITIHQNIRELKERRNFAEPQELDHIDGKLQAYSEILATFQMSAVEFDIPAKEIGF
jgi:hypothetical protein